MALLRKTALIAGVVCVLLTFGAEYAGAQLGIIPRFRVKAGLFLPQNTSLKNAVGNTWFKIGADVNLPISLVPLGTTRVGIDYAVKGSSTLIPITLTQIIQPSVAVHSPIYVGGGIGLWTARFKGGGTESRFGARLLAGVEFSERFFLEAQYDFVDGFGSARADGFSILVGTKF